ncbi:hypothetical protein L1049_016129 [Liquidambar formosana]|uniref:Dienelactone hydrolase domain-containing protein n=1 Tax=Liquidambar formosana TaxID=63359 RepID=A0AAP0RYV2_LIQFO
MTTSQCFENPPSLSSECGDGCVQELGGLKTYITGPHDSKLAILLISDVFGYDAPNLRIKGMKMQRMVVVKLARSDDIQAAVLLHPGPITVDEINEVKTPISILGAEIDRASPPEKLKQFGEILSGKSEVDCFVKIFPGVSHGWTVRYSLEDESAVKSAEEAHGDMLNWFTKCVK